LVGVDAATGRAGGRGVTRRVGFEF
jgi:hypothetical protein